MGSIEQQIESDAELAQRLQSMENSHEESRLDQSLLGSMALPRQSGNPVQRNVIENVEDTRARSGRLMVLYVVYAICELAVTSVILSRHWNDSCDVPLKYFILFFSMRFVIAVPLNFYRYRHPNDSTLTKKLLTWVDIAYLGWFIFGQIYTFRATSCASESPEIYYYALTLIIVTYIVLLMPVLLVLGLCLCLPCVFIVLGCLAENEGADDKQISTIPTREYRKGDETVECSICMNDYVETDVLSELPCGHIFHQACVNRWLPIKKTCPLCRHDITQQPNASGGSGGIEGGGGGGGSGAHEPSVVDIGSGGGGGGTANDRDVRSLSAAV